MTTEPDVLEHFVLLKKGAPCDPLARYETERILRAQPFLADASVTAYADGVDGVKIEVVTVDEPSTVASIGVISKSPIVRAVTLGSANVAGKGIHAVAAWREGFFYRDTWIANYANYQLFDRPWQFGVHATRRDVGSAWDVDLEYPFFSDIQPYAWRVAGGSSRDYIGFRSPDRQRVLLGSNRTYLDVGGFARVGPPMLLGLVGASVTFEDASTDAAPVIATDSGLMADTTRALTDRYADVQSTRVNLSFGARSVRFMEVTGFDALNGRQDVRKGLQVAVTVGSGIAMSRVARDRLYTALDLYAGAGSPNSFGAVQVRAEARKVAGVSEWNDVLSAARGAWYLRPHRRHTVVTSVEWTSGRRQRVPFQLAIGDPRGGIRGYQHAAAGGGERLVTRVEERWRIGSFRGTGDYGLAFFADAGRLHSGDAPLGIATPWLSAAGIGILAAIPPRSQRMWRLDLAYPLRREYGARFEIRITNEDRTRSFWREPNDVRWNRERTELVGERW